MLHEAVKLEVSCKRDNNWKKVKGIIKVDLERRTWKGEILKRNLRMEKNKERKNRKIKKNGQEMKVRVKRRIKRNKSPNEGLDRGEGGKL